MTNKQERFWKRAERIMKGRYQKKQVVILNHEEVPYARPWHSISHILYDLSLMNSRWRRKVPDTAVWDSDRPDSVLAYDKITDTYVLSGTKRFWYSRETEIPSIIQARFYGERDNIVKIIERIKFEVQSADGPGMSWCLEAPKY
jgi:hypothetical protein